MSLALAARFTVVRERQSGCESFDSPTEDPLSALEGRTEQEKSVGVCRSS